MNALHMIRLFNPSRTVFDTHSYGISCCHFGAIPLLGVALAPMRRGKRGVCVSPIDRTLTFLDDFDRELTVLGSDTVNTVCWEL